MNNSKQLQTKSDLTTQAFKNIEVIKQSMALAFERTNLPVFDIDNLSNDILKEFENKDINLITSAIRNGSLGVYGRTYRMSTQEVCIWVREYLKTNKVSKDNFISNPYDLPTFKGF